MNTETTKQLQGKLIDACDAMLGLVNMSSEQLVKIVSLERELTESKAEAGKWEKLHDQDTEHLVSLQKRDNYGPTETMNQTAMRLSGELAKAREQQRKFNMKHKFYYYEYTDDGGKTWTFGDYRRYLMHIVELANAQPYPFRVINQNDIEVDPASIKEILKTIESMKALLSL